jgi:hypothetical protein
MVTKNFVKTAIAGLKAWIDHKLKRLEVTDSDAVKLCAESGLVDPVASKNGEIFTDKDGKILCL